MKAVTRAMLVICTGMTCASPVVADETQDLTAQGGALIQQLAGALQTELQAAMQTGGPARGVEVCNLEAPGITYDVANSSDGWEISRSSHKLRNPTNAPDPYTAAIIDNFLARAEGGEAPQSMIFSEIVEEDNERIFRMVRAIPTAGGCLSCHGGSEVSAEVEAILSDRYPQDLARGFSEGDMRGVFTLSKVLD